MFFLIACTDGFSQYFHQARIRVSTGFSRPVNDDFRREQELSVYGAAGTGNAFSISISRLFQEKAEVGFRFDRFTMHSLKLPGSVELFNDYRFQQNSMDVYFNYRFFNLPRIEPFLLAGTGLHFVKIEHGTFRYTILDQEQNMVFEEERSAAMEQVLELGLIAGLGFDVKISDRIGVYLLALINQTFTNDLPILQEDVTGFDFRAGVFFNLIKNKNIWDD
jgi:hypothetical protein